MELETSTLVACGHRGHVQTAPAPPSAADKINNTASPRGGDAAPNPDRVAEGGPTKARVDRVAREKRKRGRGAALPDPVVLHKPTDRGRVVAHDRGNVGTAVARSKWGWRSRSRTFRPALSRHARKHRRTRSTTSTRARSGADTGNARDAETVAMTDASATCSDDLPDEVLVMVLARLHPAWRFMASMACSRWRSVVGGAKELDPGPDSDAVRTERLEAYISEWPPVTIAWVLSRPLADKPDDIKQDYHARNRRADARKRWREAAGGAGVMCVLDLVNAFSRDARRDPRSDVYEAVLTGAARRGRIDVMERCVAQSDYAVKFESGGEIPWPVWRAATHMDNVVSIKWMAEHHRKGEIGYQVYGIAARNGYLDIIELLYPRDCDKTVRDGMRKDAAKGGQASVASWLYPKCEDRLERGGAIVRLAACGRTETIDALLSLDADVPLDDTKACRNAAKHGHLGTLKRLREIGFEWDASAATYAAGKGHSDILLWLLRNGCPWDDDTVVVVLNRCNTDAMDLLHEMGSSTWKAHALKMVKWASREAEDTRMLEWAHSHGCPWDETACEMAAKAGSTRVLSWLREHGCPWDTTTCRAAAKRRHLSVLEWARDNGCPWDEGTCASAARRGCLDVLEWLHANECPWDESACAAAVEGGEISILEWLRERGCPWDKGVLALCLANDEMEMARFVMQSCPREWIIDAFFKRLS